MPGSGECGIAGLAVFLDDNHNGVADADEPISYTDQYGAYLLSAAPGAHDLHVKVPSGWHATTDNPIDVEANSSTYMSSFYFGLRADPPPPPAGAEKGSEANCQPASIRVPSRHGPKTSALPRRDRVPSHEPDLGPDQTVP